MSFREHIAKLEKSGRLEKAKKPVSKRLEISGILNALAGRPALFEKIKESEFKVAGNVFATKEAVADYLGCRAEELIPRLSKAIENPKAPEAVSKAPCQEVVVDEEDVDLDKLPILFHCEKDGGNYVSSGVFAIKDPKYGRNLDFHRCMQISKNKFSVRIVKNRHFDLSLQENGRVDVAIAVGNGANVLAAAAISVERGIDEMGIANALRPMQVAKAKTADLLVPADAEFVIEGTVRGDERAGEGPFVDLTETYDVVRQEPVMTVKRITHRKDAIWQALLPGGLEHKILMGMPREPTIYREVNKRGVKCLDVNISPGGCSWLHAIVKIDKKREEDGKSAIEGAFAGHSSCKHAFVVDSDVNIYDPLEVEWAMATRFQADSGFVVKGKEKGSSLDPSAEPGTHLTTKCGFDLTKPLVAKGKNFEKAKFPAARLGEILEGKK